MYVCVEIFFRIRNFWKRIQIEYDMWWNYELTTGSGSDQLWKIKIIYIRPVSENTIIHSSYGRAVKVSGEELDSICERRYESRTMKIFLIFWLFTEFFPIENMRVFVYARWYFLELTLSGILQMRLASLVWICMIHFIVWYDWLVWMDVWVRWVIVQFSIQGKLNRCCWDANKIFKRM